MLLKAKQGFYQNDGRKGLDEPDFMAAIGVTNEEYLTYKHRGLLIINELAAKKLLLLITPKARYFHALFKIMDLNSEEVSQ